MKILMTEIKNKKMKKSMIKKWKKKKGKIRK